MARLINYHELLQIPRIHCMGIRGQGVGIAVLDTGAYPHIDLPYLYTFKDYINHRSNFYDDSGHGTHVAGIIGSKKIGIAPEARLIILKVLDRIGEGKTPMVLEGINWVIDHKDKYNIRIMNISIGTISKKPTHNHTLVDAVERAWQNGIVVVSAAGNHGPDKTSVTTPGISETIITVGSCDDNISTSNNLFYSGRGPTPFCICKPDVVAPGSRIMSCSNRAAMYTDKSGTSMATPFVSGSIALLLSEYPFLTPKAVKILLYETSIDLGLSKNQQGWGLVNPLGLLNAAASFRRPYGL